MVLVIGFLTITNIALGYGLAVYVNKHYGTLVFRRDREAAKALGAGQVATIAAQVVAEPPALSHSAVSSILEQAIAEPQGIGSENSPATSGETAAMEPVDEENVLAGIQEFRSQLAKMNAPSDDDPVQEQTAQEEQLAAAAT
jgi:hypothetical protein